MTPLQLQTIYDVIKILTPVGGVAYDERSNRLHARDTLRSLYTGALEQQEEEVIVVPDDLETEEN